MSESNLQNYCKICNKTYKSHSGLWKHNLNHHNETINRINVDETTCKYCKTKFNSKSTRWRHEQNCSKMTPSEKNKKKNNSNNDLVLLKNKVDDLHTKIDKISTKQSIVNNNNYTQNNIVISYAPGFEPIDHLTNEQKKFVMNKGLLSLMYLIESTNFDKSKPENHSYCVTALNDKHASMIDTKTNLVVKTDKMELFDKVLAGNLNKLEKLSGDAAFTDNDRLALVKTIDRLKEILFNNKKGIKKYYSEINLLSYNNKELVQDTWFSLKNLDEMVLSAQSPIGLNQSNIPQAQAQAEPDSESDVESDEEINTEKLNKLRKQFGFKKSIIPETYDSDDSTLSEESDSDTEEATLELNIKGRRYLVDNINVYVKNPDGTKGTFYGTYSNGKVAKHKDKNIVV